MFPYRFSPFSLIITMGGHKKAELVPPQYFYIKKYTNKNWSLLENSKYSPIRSRL